MGMTEFKCIIGIWLLAQVFIVPVIFIDCENDERLGFVVDFGALVMLIVMFFGLKLIGA